MQLLDSAKEFIFLNQKSGLVTGNIHFISTIKDQLLIHLSLNTQSISIIAAKIMQAERSLHVFQMLMDLMAKSLQMNLPFRLQICFLD